MTTTPPTDADAERRLAVLQDACRDLLATARAYKRERGAARGRLDRLVCAVDLYLTSTEERHAERLERLTDEIEAAQELLARPLHDDDQEAQP